MKKALVAIACGLGLGLIPAQASAAVITLSYPPAASDPYFVGTIIDGIPSGASNELAYIQDLIEVPVQTKDVVGTSDYTGDDDTGQTEIYDRTLSTLDPLKPVFELVAKNDTGDNSWDSPVAGWLYVLAKYDQDAAGDLVFLVHVDSGDTITVPPQFNGYDLSHISLFSTTEGLECVPDGGATLMLLGGALVALGALRRRVHV